MFQGLRAKVQFFRLRKEMHPAHAYLVSVACQRPRTVEQGALRPIVSAEEASRQTRAWRTDRTGSVDHLLTRLYGPGRQDDIRAFVERGERIRQARFSAPESSPQRSRRVDKDERGN